ncbi:MAG: signal peptidase I [Oscillospiraceae bacterium]|nr:signal peptidase I [Oscillospiraceae bacterium]
MKKLWQISRWLLCSIMIAVLAMLLCYNAYVLATRASGRALPKLMGVSVAVITSGSMQDAIGINDIIIAREQKKYEIQDIILFEDERGSSVCHRIVGVAEGGFVTKGDANNTQDLEPVPIKRVAGKVVVIIPRLGAAQAFLRSPLGLMGAGMLVVIMFLWPYLRKPKNIHKT